MTSFKKCMAQGLLRLKVDIQIRTESKKHMAFVTPSKELVLSDHPKSLQIIFVPTVLLKAFVTYL